MLFPSVLFIVLACRESLNTCVIRGCGTSRKSSPLRHSIARSGRKRFFCIFGYACRKRTLRLIGNVDSRDCVVLLASVLGQTDAAVCLEKSTFIQRLPSHAQSVALHVITSVLSVCFFALVMNLIMSARRFQRTHLLSRMESSLNVSENIDMGIIVLTPISKSENEATYAAVIDTACPCVFEVDSDCKNKSCDVCYVDGTR